MPIVLALWRLRQKDCEFKVSLDYIARPCLKNNKRNINKIDRLWREAGHRNEEPWGRSGLSPVCCMRC
jgi:hypothetical protein